MNIPYPRKLHIEITSRCNFTCSMCMKYSKNSDVGNYDLAYEEITSVAEVLPHLEALVLNGIGEPLLHPDLLQIIDFARQRMPESAWIGLQSNGALLSTNYAEQLMRKGLNRICLSMDSAVDSAASHNGHGAGHAEAILQAFAGIRSARKKINPCFFELGVEIVLMRENVQELPELVDRAGRLGADFVIVSHLLPYQSRMETSSLFNPNTAEATSLFADFCKQAQRLGITVDRSIFPLWDNPRNSNAARLYPLYKEMQNTARDREIALHPSSLVEWQNGDMQTLTDIYRKAEKTAARYQLRLELPPLQPTQQRDCPFAGNDACFVTARGEVAPCNALLHSYSCYMDGEEKRIQAKSFGNITERTLLSIWQSEQYQIWRAEVHSDAYPFCRSCALGPCADVTNRNYPFTNDCYGFKVPCGYCMWNLGALRCL